jgi:PAS domain-containing protein
MTAPLIISFLLTTLSLIVTSGVLLLVLWRNRDTRVGRALFQLLGCLALLQAATLFTHISLLADFSDSFVEHILKLTLICFGLVAVAALSMLIHAADAMKEIWPIICRSGITVIVVLQPALWENDIFNLEKPLNHTLFGGPYTDLGMVVISILGAYMGLALFAGWNYWRRINAPLLAGAVLALVGAQTASLSIPSLRELSLTAATSGFVSGVIGYHLLHQSDLTPRPIQTHWLQAASHTPPNPQAVTGILNGIAEQARLLVRTDVVGILLAIGPDRLEVAATAGPGQAMVGRQVRIGEGLAGRVMQALQPMRVDHYSNWNGRAADFDDMVFYASLSVPLIYRGDLVGTLNANETSPGRVFTHHDQMLLELLAPQAAITIATSRLERELQAAQSYLQAILTNTTDAIMIFDGSGVLQHANPTAQHYFHHLLNPTNQAPTAIQIAACTQDSQLTDALVRWTTNAPIMDELEIGCEGLGRFAVQLRTIQHADPENLNLLIIMHKLTDQPATPA